MDYYIKCQDKTELDSVLDECGLMIEGEYIIASENHSLVVLGTISRVVDEVEEALDGYHANIRMLNDEPLCEHLLPYLVVPQNPVNVWF
jgi:hypothetical protein